MKAVFQDVIGNKVTIELPQNKQFSEFKNDIMTKFNIDSKKKEVQVFYHNQKLENDSTLVSIKYKEGDILTVMSKRITDNKAQPKAKPQTKNDEPKPEPSPQASQNSQTPQQPQPTTLAPSTPVRPPLQPTDTGLPIGGQRPTLSNSQPYPPANPTLDEIARINCFKIRDFLSRSNPNLVFRALQTINPQLYERVEANRGPFLRMFGIQQAPEYVNEMIQNIDQTVSRYTPQEREAIQRLVNMGYEVDLVVQVFEAAERDEQRAAMILSNL